MCEILFAIDPPQTPTWFPGNATSEIIGLVGSLLGGEDPWPLGILHDRKADCAFFSGFFLDTHFNIVGLWRTREKGTHTHKHTNCSTKGGHS